MPSARPLWPTRRARRWTRRSCGTGPPRAPSRRSPSGGCASPGARHPDVRFDKSACWSKLTPRRQGRSHGRRGPMAGTASRGGRMKTVEQLLESKRHNLVSVAPGTTVLDALKVMAEKEIGAVVVLDGVQLAGIFSERDYARKVVLQGKSSKETP